MKLYYNPLSGYSHKALIAFHEKAVTFEPQIVDLGSEQGRAEYRKLYPLGKVPLLVLDNGWFIPESTIIVEYLDTHFDSGTRLIPKDPDQARQTRFHDRMNDLYLAEPVGTLLFDKLKFRQSTPEQLDRARFYIDTMFGFMDQQLAGKTWLMGDAFTLADCAAAPALFYAEQVAPFKDRPNIVAYWQRLKARPSYRKVLTEAEPHVQRLLAAA